MESRDSKEEEKIMALKELVDSTARKIMWGGLSKDRAGEIIEKTRHYALDIFPDKAKTYDLIYGARFRRLVDQFIILSWAKRPRDYE